VSYIATHGTHVLRLTGEHIEIVVAALIAALAIALPLGIISTRSSRAGLWLLGILGAIYTIPSLALLAIFVQLFGLGTAPIFIALVAYGQFMLVRNIVAGIQGIDPALLDAARGVGMTERQLLLRVELPLALPVIVGGIRIAAVAMIALATLGGYVGAGGLGSLIFLGLTIHHNDMIVAGSIAASLLAIIADGTLRLTERAVRHATR